MKWFRGISMRIDDVGPDVNLSPSSMTYLDAAFAIAGDPLCAVDTVYEHIYLISKTFGELGIELPPHRHLPQMVHPDDMDTLRHWLKRAVASPMTPVGPIEARFAAHGGGWKILLLVGTAVSMSDGEPHHVLCRVTVAGTDSQGTGLQE